MPINLATLFTTPQDIWDLLSVEGVDLREDDHQLATGAIVSTTADALVGATTIAVNLLPVPLLRGAQLTFDGAGMAVPVTAQLSAVANFNDVVLNVLPLAAQINTGAQARDSGVNAATGARLLVGARKGTSEVKLYCNQRYDDQELKKAGSVLDWATIIASRFLAKRRLQPCPKGLEDDYKEVVKRLEKVQAGVLAIEDIGTRGVDWPTITNITVNPAYDFQRARVEVNMSEQTPTAYAQFVDWNSAAWIEF